MRISDEPVAASRSLWTAFPFQPGLLVLRMPPVLAETRAA